MIENYFNGTIELVFVSQAISSFKVVRKEVFLEDGFIRVKCNLRNGDIFEFAEYVVLHKNKLTIETYSYHWQKKDGSLIKRWDNVPHHKEVATFPHHLHFGENKVVGSNKVKLKIVLDEIEKTITTSDEL